jgi:hypothetical protein
MLGALSGERFYLNEGRGSRLGPLELAAVIS